MRGWLCSIVPLVYGEVGFLSPMKQICAVLAEFYQVISKAKEVA